LGRRSALAVVAVATSSIVAVFVLPSMLTERRDTGRTRRSKTEQPSEKRCRRTIECQDLPLATDVRGFNSNFYI